MDLLADLNDAQREAVTHLEGPLLILAGAGSGKTRVITYRIAHLLQQGVKPYNLLAITFTNKAADEMRKRVDALVPGNRVWISTFHSLGARLIRQYHERFDLGKNCTIYDQADRHRLVKAAFEAAEVSASLRITPERVEGAISKAKNQLLLPPNYASKASDYFEEVVARVYPIYQKRLKEANALDFDDLLMLPALGLKHDAELRAELDSRFRFVLIDEYQDTNSAQYAIAKGLSIDNRNLCVVGDPDQSIYRWRGADIRNILDFERDFPDAKVIKLERNYRSTKSILHAASTLIARNKSRKPKTLKTENPTGAPVRVILYETGLDEADSVARRIAKAVDEGKRHYRDHAVFVRINALTRAFEQAFVKHRVPFQIVRGLAFFDRKENRDVLAYLRLLVNPADNLSFERVVNEPARGIGKVTLEHLRAYAEPREISLLAATAEVDKIVQLKGKAAAGLKQFAELMTELRQLLELPPHEVIRQVIAKTGYRQLYEEGKEPEDQERLANIEEMITAAKQLADEDGSKTIADFLENITLASDVDSWDNQQDHVSVMTLHAAKGLEFPVVYMAAVEQGLLPHERSLQNFRDSEEIEEERRLAFVGMTRAREELNLCHAKMREYRGQTMYAMPSQFLKELPEDDVEHVDLADGSASTAYGQWRTGSRAADEGWRDAGFEETKPKQLDALPQPEGTPDYAEGMMVKHAHYGLGQVTELSGYGKSRKIKVKFNQAGVRTFVAEKAALAVVRK